jgi:cellulose synthase/poly-beta-1,6-N-acetylglucosamine synthase-like glycosyltransferase
MQLVTGLFTLAGATGILVTIPSALELLLVTTGALRRQTSLNTEANCNRSLAVIVPAHNEEKLVGRCVLSLREAAAKSPNISIVVVADNCTDNTADCARQAGARVLVRTNPENRGKGFALRFAFQELLKEPFTGFVIVDADSTVSANFFHEVSGSLASGAEALQTRYRVAPPLNTRRKQLMDVAFLAFNVLRPRGRDGYGLSAGILGNGFALSRQTLLDVPYSADSIVEDLEYHLLLVKAGKRVVFLDRATVYGDMPDDVEAQTSQRARWEGGRAAVMRMNAGALAIRVLKGQMRTLEPLLELLTLPLAYLFILAVALCAIPLGLFRFYGFFLSGLMIAHVCSSIALSGNAKSSFKGLLEAPMYLLWKVTKMTTIIKASRRETPWLRTKRSEDSRSEMRNV